MFTYKTGAAYSHRSRFKGCLETFFKLSMGFLILLLLVRAFEIVFAGLQFGFASSSGSVVMEAVWNDFIFFLKADFWIFWLYFVFYYFSRKAARGVYIFIAAIIILIQLGLIFYFTAAMVPLGADLFGYSSAEIKQTVGAAGSLNISSILSFIFLIILIWLVFRTIKKIKAGRWTAVIFSFIVLVVWLVPRQSMVKKAQFKNEFINNLVLNKTAFFARNTKDYFFPPDNDLDIYADNFIGINSNEGVAGRIWVFDYINPGRYPFLHQDSSADVLSPFFLKDSAKPNIVLLLVEGLGRAFANEGAYLGNFTPFLDSLSGHSLYWSNFMSEGGRTFAVLPSILGSLPFNRNGFCELGNNMPPQLSLMSLLKKNGYRTSFFYGGDADFDHMDLFLKHQAIDAINDKSTFGNAYTKMPESATGFSWGYGDRELFRRYFDVINQHTEQPRLNVILTLSTHSPFLINDEGRYLQRFTQRMTELHFSNAERSDHEKYKMQYASILFMDDAIRYFFSRYEKRPEFKHTIFLITGDHRMPEIPMSTKIDRYHVPLIIYSPLLKRTAHFNSISTHFDITPSLLAFLKADYHMNVPSVADWMGTGLDTVRSFRNVHAYPYMQTKNEIIDFVMGNWMLHNNELYQITPDMGMISSMDPQKMSELRNGFNQFKERNSQFIQGAPLIPDSVYNKYYPR